MWIKHEKIKVKNKPKKKNLKFLNSGNLKAVNILPLW